ncbi:MAG: tetratricopeptide repeat protein [Planctomycetes bacterium]|nr:tetratricopeptide repeat protein [Planctomycetota bacterium]
MRLGSVNVRAGLIRASGLVCLLVQASVWAQAPTQPQKAPPGFQQMVTAAFDIQTDAPNYIQKLSQSVFRAEQRFYQLFELQPGFIRGDDPKAKLDNRLPSIKGDQLSKWGYRPWIEIRVYNNYKDYVDEYFDEINRMHSLINKTPVKVETPEERALRRIREGVPGAYYMRITDYDGKSVLRRIRAYIADKSHEQVEMDVLHEMGHCFSETFLFEFGGAPRSGQESEKRGTPAWIGEGVAQLFQYNWADAGHARKEKLRNWGMIYEAVEAGHHYEFDKFINVTNAHNLASVASDPLKARINYIQSFSLIQYMVEKDWQRFMQFLKNCRVNNLQDQFKGKKVSELYSVQNKSFQDAFTIPIPGVEKYWKEHVLDTGAKQLKADASGYYYCGLYWLDRRDLAKATERFEKAIAGAPGKGEGYLGMGRVAILKQDFKAALEQLGKATELNPKDEDSWYYLGSAQVQAGKPKEAMASFEKAIALYSNFHEAFDGLADAQFAQQQFKEAHKNYDRAYQISRLPQYLLYVGRAAFYAHEYADAQRSFSSFCNVFTQDPNGAFWYGMSAWRLGDKEFALKKLQEASKLQPNNNDFKVAVQMAQKGEMLYFQNETKQVAKDPSGLTTTAKPVDSKTEKKTDVVEEE